MFKCYTASQVPIISGTTWYNIWILKFYFYYYEFRSKNITVYFAIRYQYRNAYTLQKLIIHTWNTINKVNFID